MRKEDLRIVFMGTPEFAVASLAAIVEAGYRVVAVVTQPDRPVGRHGSVLQPPAVKVYAQEHGLPVLQPEKMKDPVFVERLRSYDANLQVVVAFRMLPEVVWAMPAYGTFNVHAALLPQYRGAAPINWAVINGERQTGVTTFFLDHDIDTGRVILQRPFDIPYEADAGYVHDGLMHLGAQACIETLQRIAQADGQPQAVEQAAMTRVGETLRNAPKLNKEVCRIDTAWSPECVYNFVRGLSPLPGAWVDARRADGTEVQLKLLQTRVSDAHARGDDGTLVADGLHLYIICGGKPLEILTLQPAGKKRMAARDYINGHMRTATDSAKNFGHGTQ